MKQITSRDNATFKSLRALTSDAREPRKQGRTLIDGVHLVSTALARNLNIVQWLVSESGQSHPEIQALLPRLQEADGLLLRDSLFAELAGVATPTGIAAVIALPESLPLRADGDVVMLDAVQDAGNVGAILRTAAAAGVAQIVLGPGCAGAWTPRVLRAAQGAHFSLSIIEQADLLAALNTRKDIPSVAAVAHEGADLYGLPCDKSMTWIFGNEGAGVSPSLIAAATNRVTISLASASESLNVAAAAAVCLFEMRRQRLAT